LYHDCATFLLSDFDNLPKSYEKPGNHEDFRVFTGTPKGTRFINAPVALCFDLRPHPYRMRPQAKGSLV